MSENQEWNARLFADKVIKKAVQDEIEKLALVVLGNHKLKITYRKEGFDNVRPSETGRPYIYRGSWREWIVLGHTKTDIYLEVLKMLANDSSTYYPIVSYRYNNDRVEREEYEVLQEENKQIKESYKDRQVIIHHHIDTDGAIKGREIANLIDEWLVKERIHPDDLDALFAHELLEKLEKDE